MISFPGDRGNLYASAVIANLASAAIGTHYTWSSPTIPKLQRPDSWLHIGDNEAAWIGSLTALGTVFGPFLGGWLVNLVGRKRTIVVAVILSTLAWLGVLLSRNIWEIYVGRVVGGLGGGVAFLVLPLYVAEISEVAVRGALGSLFGLFLVGGYVLEYVVGPFVSYSLLIIVNLIPALVFFVAVLVIPESPYYHLRRGDASSALTSLAWLRKGRSSAEVQKELDIIKEDVERSMRSQAKLSNLLLVRGYRKGLFISAGMFTGQQISGVNVILFFTQTIFIDAKTNISSSGSTILIGVLLLGARGFAAPLVRAIGMKKVFIGSAFGMAVFQFFLTVYFYFNDEDSDLSNFSWVPISTLIGYILCLTVGFGPLPWAVVAEVFPPNVKALASSIVTSYNWFIPFLLTRYFTDVNDTFGPHVAFFIFTVGSVLALIFTIFFLPDTRGMTLQQVTDMLDDRRVQRKRAFAQGEDA